MEMITPSVYTETKIRGCNPSIVFTSEGSVFIDTAQWLSTLLEMREFAKKRGPIRYLINTEAHIDHIFGNHWFAGESLVVGHENLKNIFWTVADDKPCYEYSVDVLERQDPAALPHGGVSGVLLLCRGLPAILLQRLLQGGAEHGVKQLLVHPDTPPFSVCQ